MAATMEQPKIPAGGGYGVYLSENRDTLVKSLPTGYKITDIGKKAGEMWRALSEDARKPHVAKFQEKMAAYKLALTEFEAQGGVRTPRKNKRKLESMKKAKKDPNAPKRPSGGGYGLYVAENRATITSALPAGATMIDVTKKAGELWRALPDEAKTPFEQKFREKFSAYKTAMEEYKKANPPQEDVYNSSSGGETPTKRSRPEGSAVKASPYGVVTCVNRFLRPEPTEQLDTGALQKAAGLELERAFRSLVSHEAILEQGVSHEAILAALQENGGLVNKAKTALLGA